MRFWPFKKDAADDGRIALGNFSLTAQLAGSSGRSMQIAGYIYSDDDKDALNARLDMYQEVIERQRIRSEIPELEAKREQMIKSISQATDVLDELKTKRDAGTSLTSQERMQITNMSQSIAKMNEEVDKGTEAIKEARLKAGVG